MSFKKDHNKFRKIVKQVRIYLIGFDVRVRVKIKARFVFRVRIKDDLETGLIRKKYRRLRLGC